jgi:hypothetical protein
MDPYAQVAGQVYFTNKAVREQLDHIEDASWLAVDYQDFCAGPEMYFHMIREKLLRMDYDVELSYLGPTQFHASQHDPSENHEADLILKAYEFFSHG